MHSYSPTATVPFFSCSDSLQMGDALWHLASCICGILKQSSVSSKADTAPITQHLYIALF